MPKIISTIKVCAQSFRAKQLAVAAILYMFMVPATAACSVEIVQGDGTSGATRYRSGKVPMRDYFEFLVRCPVMASKEAGNCSRIEAFSVRFALPPLVGESDPVWTIDLTSEANQPPKKRTDPDFENRPLVITEPTPEALRRILKADVRDTDTIEMLKHMYLYVRGTTPTMQYPGTYRLSLNITYGAVNSGTAEIVYEAGCVDCSGLSFETLFNTWLDKYSRHIFVCREIRTSTPREEIESRMQSWSNQHGEELRCCEGQGAHLCSFRYQEFKKMASLGPKAARLAKKKLDEFDKSFPLAPKDWKLEWSTYPPTLAVAHEGAEALFSGLSAWKGPYFEYLTRGTVPTGCPALKKKNIDRDEFREEWWKCNQHRFP